MGFWDDLERFQAFQAIIEASKNENGRPDPWKAAAMAAAEGYSPSQVDELGVYLGAQGAYV